MRHPASHTSHPNSGCPGMYVCRCHSPTLERQIRSLCQARGIGHGRRSNNRTQPQKRWHTQSQCTPRPARLAITIVHANASTAHLSRSGAVCRELVSASTAAGWNGIIHRICIRVRQNGAPGGCCSDAGFSWIIVATFRL